MPFNRHPQINGKLTLKRFLVEAHVRWGGPPIGHTTLESMVDEALEKLGHARRVTLLIGSLHVLPDVVAQSDLIAVVPELLAKTASETLPIQILPLPFKVPIVEVIVTWHERLHNDPGHKWLRQTIIGMGRSIQDAMSGKASIG